MISTVIENDEHDEMNSHWQIKILKDIIVRL